MSDITREEAIEHLKNMKMPHDKFYEETDETNKALIDKGNEALGMAIESLKNQKTGHWKRYNGKVLWECSECGEIIYSETEQDRKEGHKYCNRCGAKMEGENNES